jgi:hypothetical protein
MPSHGVLSIYVTISFHSRPAHKPPCAYCYDGLDGEVQTSGKRPVGAVKAIIGGVTRLWQFGFDKLSGSIENYWFISELIVLQIK